MKNLTLTATAVALTTVASGVTAGGLDRATFSPSILFKEGSYVEISTARTKPKVTPDSFVAPVAIPSGRDITEDFTTTQAAFKTDLSEKVSLAFGYNTNPFGVDINYAPLAGTALDGLSSLRANLSSTALNLTAKYKVNDAFSVFAGVKHQTVSGTANVSVPLSQAAGGPVDGDVALSSDSDLNFHVGVAYEKPEIALRVAFTYETAAQFAPNVLAVNSGNFNTGPGEINVPKSYLLEFQSGVAKDTLVFGSIRHAKWSDAQVFMSAPFMNAQLSDFDDSTSYSIGVGRRFSDKISASLSLTHAPSDCDDASLLGPTCNDNTLSIGGEYKLDNGAAIAAGVSFRKYDTSITSAAQNSIVFDDDTLMTVGIKLSKSF